MENKLKENDKESAKDKITEYDFVRINASLLTYIGISLIILGCVNLFIPIPTEYQIGVAISAFFFVLADLLSIDPKLNKTNLRIYTIIIFIAIISFFMLPILLIVSQFDVPFLSRIGNGMSFVSLGIVLGILDIKNQKKVYENTMKIYDAHIEATKLYKELIQNHEAEIQVYKTNIQFLNTAIEEMVHNNERLKEGIDEEIDEVKEQLTELKRLNDNK